MRQILKSALALALVTCATSATSAQQESSQVRYSVVYLIHGDGDYLYHTGEGVQREADQQVLEEAQNIGKKATQGEVLIFHIRPEKKIVGIFPKKDRRFLHYRKGKLVRDERYSPAPDTALNPFGAETARYHRYRSGNTDTDPARILLYFGHEIPTGPGRGYHSSQSHLLFNRERFVRGVDLFSGNTKLDFTVLSTCENGTSAMAALLEPHTHALLASPQDLHLSHINSQPLLWLEQHPDLPADSLALRMAEETFERLSSTIHTVISLSVYQLDQMGEDLTELSDQYFIFRSENRVPDENGENIDCAELPFIREHLFAEGVTTYYRAPKFGSNAKKENHSGWGCRN